MRLVDAWMPQSYYFARMVFSIYIYNMRFLIHSLSHLPDISLQTNWIGIGIRWHTILILIYMSWIWIKYCQRWMQMQADRWQECISWYVAVRYFFSFISHILCSFLYSAYYCIFSVYDVTHVYARCRYAHGPCRVDAMKFESTCWIFIWWKCLINFLAIDCKLLLVNALWSPTV